MRRLKSGIGLGSFLFQGILAIGIFAAVILAYYLYVPAVAVLLANAIVLLVFMLVADHVPIGMHGRICYRYGVQSGDITPPAGVPQWIARFASEDDPGLLLLSLFGSTLASVVLMVADLFIPGPFLSRPVVDLGSWQLFYVPHLIGLTTWVLIAFRRALMDSIFALARAQTVSQSA